VGFFLNTVYIIGLVLCRSGKIHSDISPTPPPVFRRGSKSAKLGFDIRHQLPLSGLVWKRSNISEIWNISADSGRLDDLPKYWLRSCEIAVVCKCSIKLAKSSPNDWRDVGWPQVAMHSHLPHFLVTTIVLKSSCREQSKYAVYKAPTFISSVNIHKLLGTRNDSIKEASSFCRTSNIIQT